MSGVGLIGQRRGRMGLTARQFASCSATWFDFFSPHGTNGVAPSFAEQLEESYSHTSLKQHGIVPDCTCQCLTIRQAGGLWLLRWAEHKDTLP